VSRVLLLSDGLANHGETYPNALAQRARDLRAKGITTSTFGLGADFDERPMSRLSTEGGGFFYFIEQPAGSVNLTWSPSVATDLEAIRDYIAADSPRYADLVVHRILHAVFHPTSSGSSP
jgi:secreted protein with Ig-like and vWFA domain